MISKTWTFPLKAVLYLFLLSQTRCFNRFPFWPFHRFFNCLNRWRRSSDKFWARSSLSSNEPSAESFTDSPVSLWSRSPAKRSVEKLFESDEVVSPVEDVLACVIVVLFSAMVVLFSDIFELSCEIVVLFCGIEQFLVLSLIPKPQLWLQLLHWSHSVHAGGIIFFYFFNPFYKKNLGNRAGP